MWRRLLAALAALTTAAAAPVAKAEPPVWIVRDHDSEMVLFGSVHVLPKGLKWRPPALEQALKGADDLWFELPVDPATESETARLAGEKGVLPPDQSLFKMLPQKDAARLMRVAGAYGVSTALLDRLQPWMVEIALTGAAYMKAGAAADDGVEKSLAAVAPRTARRRALETPAEQIAMLSGQPMGEQLASLRETLKELEDTPDGYMTLVRAWMAGDVKALDREALEPLRRTTPSLFRRLVSDRNAAWTAVLDERLKGKGRTVVVVGVGHLVGKGGLPARLRALGYEVKGP